MLSEKCKLITETASKLDMETIIRYEYRLEKKYYTFFS